MASKTNQQKLIDHDAVRDAADAFAADIEDCVIYPINAETNESKLQAVLRGAFNEHQLLALRVALEGIA